MAKRVNNTEFGRLLKGSDVVDAKKQAVAGVIMEVRDSPQGFGSPYIVDFDTDLLPGIHSWPLNVTQARRIVDITGESDPGKWEGMALGLAVCQVNNPKEAKNRGVTEYLVDSLEVAFVTGVKEAAKKRTTKPKYSKAVSPAAGRGGKKFSDADVPF